jgi:hypothetical protein
MSKNKPSHAPASAPAAPATVAAQKITIDGVSYDLAELSDIAKRQLGNVRLVDQELAHLQRQGAIASVARSAYVAAAAAALPKEPTAPKDGARSVVIDGVAHDWASLGERVQGLIAGIRAADQELARVNAQVQMSQTARGAFAQGVKQNLPKRESAASAG